MQEDDRLRVLFAQHNNDWAAIGAKFKTRTDKSCRQRWIEHLNPRVKKGEFTEWEDATLVMLALRTCPLGAEAADGHDKSGIFPLSEVALLDRGIELVDPSLPAALARPGLEFGSNSGPVAIVLRIQDPEPIIFLQGGRKRHSGWR